MMPCKICQNTEYHLYTIKVDGKQSRCFISLCDACVEKCRRKHPNIEYNKIVYKEVEL